MPREGRGICGETAKASGNSPGGQGLGVSLRQKKQLPVIHFSQQIDTHQMPGTRQSIQDTVMSKAHTPLCSERAACSGDHTDSYFLGL